MITIIVIIAMNMMIGTTTAATIGPVQLQVSGWGRGLTVTVYIKQDLVLIILLYL